MTKYEKDGKTSYVFRCGPTMTRKQFTRLRKQLREYMIGEVSMDETVEIVADDHNCSVSLAEQIISEGMFVGV